MPNKFKTKRKPLKADEFQKIINGLKAQRAKIQALYQALRYIGVSINTSEQVSIAEFELTHTMKILRHAHRLYRKETGHQTDM